MRVNIHFAVSPPVAQHAAANDGEQVAARVRRRAVPGGATRRVASPSAPRPSDASRRPRIAHRSSRPSAGVGLSCDTPMGYIGRTGPL